MTYKRHAIGLARPSAQVREGETTGEQSSGPLEPLLLSLRALASSAVPTAFRYKLAVIAKRPGLPEDFVPFVIEGRRIERVM